MCLLTLSQDTEVSLVAIEVSRHILLPIVEHFHLILSPEYKRMKFTKRINLFSYCTENYFSVFKLKRCKYFFHICQWQSIMNISEIINNPRGKH